MAHARKHPNIAAVSMALLLSAASAQERKEFTYRVGPQAVISITNTYGAVTIKPSENRQVVVTTVSDAVRSKSASLNGLASHRQPLCSRNASASVPATSPVTKTTRRARPGDAVASIL